MANANIVTMNSTISTAGNNTAADTAAADKTIVETSTALETGDDTPTTPSEPGAAQDDPASGSSRKARLPSTPANFPAAFVPAVVNHKVALCKEILGYEFEDPLLLVEALNAARFGVPSIYGGTKHDVQRNKILALVGDKVIETVLVVKFWKLMKGSAKGKQQTSKAISRFR
jgi:hypothetical protein